MNHPTDAELLLLAYSEVPEPRNAAIESHVAACHTCRATLVELERGRVALDVALPPRRRSTRMWIALAAGDGRICDRQGNGGYRRAAHSTRTGAVLWPAELVV